MLAFYSKAVIKKDKTVLESLGDMSELAIENAGSGVEHVVAKPLSTRDEPKKDNHESEKPDKINEKLSVLDPNKKEPKSFSTNPIVKVLVIIGVVIAAIGLFALIASIALGVTIIAVGIIAIFIGVFAPIHAKRKQNKI